MLEFELVLPCYNESKSLHSIVTRASMEAEKSGLTPDQFKLVLVENGSKDDSLQRMHELSKTELGAWFRIVPVPVNQGYGFGLFSGLSTCQAPFVGWSHADEQTDPADAFRAFQVIKKSADPQKTFVKGVRVGRDPKDAFVSQVFETLAWIILNVRFHEINAQPKVFHQSFLKKMIQPPWNFAFDLYMLYQAGKNHFKISEIEVLFPPRKFGTSNWASTFLGRYKTILGMIAYMWRLRKEKQ